MTKNEKQLIEVIQSVMARKKIEGNAEDFYKITKRSNKDYLAEVRIGNAVFASKGKDTKDVIKNLIKEIK